MLFRRAELDGIAAGEITLAFRRWRRLNVRAGGRLTTAAGVLAIERVDVVTPEDVTDAEAKRAGHASAAALLAGLAKGRAPAEARLYRITFRLAGPDPRTALRADDRLDETELADIATRLERLDRASRHGPWTRDVLGLVGRYPSRRAADLAAERGLGVLAFKRDVRKLKALGLTESLEVGYRLSPRGRAVLDDLSRS